MITVLSATNDDFYAMPLPFAVYSWLKAGARTVIVFTPKGDNPKLHLAQKYCDKTTFLHYTCEEKRSVTYSQVLRLFGGCLRFTDHTESMVTGDSDMCVFGGTFINNDDGGIHIVGSDLTPPDQVPMCYIQMPVYKWRNIMGCYDSETNLRTCQDCVSELIDPIEGLNIRGEQWNFDQWYANKKLKESGEDINYHARSNGQNQFATHRADRDGWHFNPDGLVDAHLPRPLTDEDNMNKVYELFKIKYPNDNLDWMWEYYHAYKQLL